MGKSVSASAQEWRAHWLLVLASALGMSMASIEVGTLGAFMVPLEQEFHWPRAQISAGLSIYAAMGVLLAPIYGRMVDRFGPRRMALPGVLACGASMALFSTTTGSFLQWMLLWGVYSLTAQIPKPLTWTAAVSSEFEASRGLAIALMLAGGSIGGMVAPILANHLIGTVGWRSAYVVIGLGWGSLAFIFCYPFFFSRGDRLRTSARRTVEAAPAAILLGVSASQGLRSARLVKLGVAALLSNSLLVGLMIHMIPLLTATGLSRGSATWLFGLAGIGSIAGSLLSGALVNRVPGNILAAFFFSLPVLSCSMLLAPSSSAMERLFPVLLQSISGGAQTHLYAYLATRYFGLRAYGTLYGVIASLLALGVGVGPIAAGFAFDRTHSYDPFLIAAIPISLVVALLLFSLGRYPLFAEVPERSFDR